MDSTVIILSILAGSVVAAGRGSLMNEMEPPGDRNDLPMGRQIFCIVLAVALMVLVYFRLKGQSGDPDLIGPLMVMVISMAVISFIFLRYGPDGEPVIVIPHSKTVFQRYLNLGRPASQAEFRDPELDDLIEAGRLSDARKYLKDKLDLSKEMGDVEIHRKYEGYGARISAAAMKKPGDSNEA